jgi:hypothetical protein
MAACTTARDVGNPRTEVVALSQLAALPGGDAAAAEDAMQRLGGELEVGTAMNARLALFRANGRSEHLAEAKRLLDGMLAAVPESDRASMLANVRLYREVAGTAREQGLA